MMEQKKAIVFIDGNNFYHNAKVSKIKPSSVNLLKLCEYICQHFNFTRIKSIYYNSIPDLRDGSTTYYNHMKYLDKVGSYKEFLVKTRKLQKNSTKEILRLKHEALAELSLCGVCRSIVESNCEACVGTFKSKEKGVDVMIAIDMINLCVIKNECDACVLISGDADFIPAMDLIRENNKTVVSSSLYKGYSFNLREKHGWFILDRQRVLDLCCD